MPVLCRAFSAPENGLFSEQPPYSEFAKKDQFCGNLSASTYWNTYYTANGTRTDGFFDPDLIDAMTEQITGTNSSTATFYIVGSPTLPDQVSHMGSLEGLGNCNTSVSRPLIPDMPAPLLHLHVCQNPCITIAQKYKQIRGSLCIVSTGLQSVWSGK